jgi:hypothetical protein
MTKFFLLKLDLQPTSRLNSVELYKWKRKTEGHVFDMAKAFSFLIGKCRLVQA